MSTNIIRYELEQAASKATQEFLDKHFGGKDGGLCGFAWVTIFPEHKGNTTLGKQERKILEALGARKDYTGKAYQIWNPSNNHCQSVDAKSAGAVAAAEVLKKYGFKAYAADRLD
jgi:hypothetical protein